DYYCLVWDMSDENMF
nr:immunoglobulin light chain junction region [Macaca mulatta]